MGMGWDGMGAGRRRWGEDRDGTGRVGDRTGVDRPQPA